MAIEVTAHGRVAVVTVNRPEVLNALSSELLEELLRARLALFQADEDILAARLIDPHLHHVAILVLGHRALPRTGTLL